jgi:hypothetical protein
MVEIKILPLLLCAIYCVFDDCSIVWMRAPEYQFDRRFIRPVAFKDSKGLL